MAEHDKTTVDELYKIATWLRIDSIESTNAAKSGHPTSCASAAEIMACLFFKVMHYEVANPRNPNSDRFILSKGHAAPILYSAWAEAGLFPREDLLNLRKIDCDLEGHPTPRLSFVDVASGSLGQGLSAASGMAYVGKYIDCGENHGQSPFRVFCLIGDGESAEGSNWEAMAFASYYKLDNLYAIFDVNRLGQSQPTMLQHDVDVYRARAEAFGFAAYVVNGHSVEELLTVFENAAARNDGRPTAIIAQTFKGFDFPGISNLEDWHGKPISSGGNEVTANVLQHLREKVEALTSSGDSSAHSLKPPAPVSQSLHDLSHFVGGSEKVLLSSPPNYHKGQLVATRQAYGTALVKLGENNKQVIGLDGDTKNSTFSIKLRDKRPGQFIECFIAEQNLAGVAIGAACRGRTIPFASTFACFFTRAFDQIRMAAISQSHCNFVGSHAGVSIGEDGPSQMALEDLAMFRSIPNAVVFYPTDAVATERAVELAANQPSICFIRTGRPNAPVIYANDEVFEIGKAKVVRSSDHDVVTVIGAGVTLTETLAAADQLAAENIHIRVIDPFTIKPIDSKAIIEAAKATGGRIITVEDHYPEGGLGEAVLTAVSEETGIIVRKIAITHLPRSGKPEELLALFGIDAAGIAKAVKAFL